MKPTPRTIPLLLIGLALAHLGAGAAAGVEDPVAASEAAWEEEMRQLVAEGDEEAALELARIAVDQGQPERAREWLRRAEALGAEVPPDLEQATSASAEASSSAGGWGTGSVERRSLSLPPAPDAAADPCDRPGVDLDLALRRADLALADRDLERWVDAIVPVVRAGCRSPALVERIERARATEETLEVARDREIADAVRRGRPTVGTQVGRSLEPSSSDMGVWGQVAGELIAVMEGRRGSGGDVGHRIPEGADQATRNAYAGIWADTQDQIEHDPDGNEWDRVNEQVKRISRRGTTGTLPAPEAREEPGAGSATGSGTPPLAPAPAGGSLGSGGPDCGPADESYCDAASRRAGSTCVCCQGSFGIPENCHWDGGQAPRASLTIAACLNTWESDSRSCDTSWTAKQSGGWWVWHAEEGWTVEQQVPGVETPVTQSYRRMLWGLDKPRGCSPADEGRSSQSTEFVRKGDAGPFTWKEALDYIRAQQSSCCAAASGQSRKPIDCE